MFKVSTNADAEFEVNVILILAEKVYIYNNYTGKIFYIELENNLAVIKALNSSMSARMNIFVFVWILVFQREVFHVNYIKFVFRFHIFLKFKWWHTQVFLY
jgi:hypothetical protein